MLNSLLFGSYCFSIGAIGYNLAKQKLMDDFERDIKEYREYDFENEKIKVDKEAKCIILAKYKAKKEEAAVLYQKRIAFFNVLDPARLFKTRLSQKESFTMEFTPNSKNDVPLEVHFEK